MAPKNIAIQSTVAASTQMPPYYASWVINGSRGTQPAMDYWNNNNNGATGETLTVTFKGTQTVCGVILRMPIMSTSGPYTLSGISVALKAGSTTVWSASGISITGGTTLASCVDYGATMVPVDADSLVVTFGAPNADGWVFLGEIVVNSCVRTVSEAVAWLNNVGTDMAYDSIQTMNNGVLAYPPQVGSGYDAFWLRDFAYILQGVGRNISHENLLDAAYLFARANRASDGAAVDCIKYDGTPIYMPGFGTMGSNPVLDGPMMLVDVIYQTWQATGSSALLTNTVSALEAALASIPLSSVDRLPQILATGWDRCPYGFTDTVRKQGEQFFDGLLLVQAKRQMAEIYTALGRTADASSMTTEAANLVSVINNKFWNSTVGLYTACTGQCSGNYDVWGSVFAVRLGVPDATKRTQIANYLVMNFNTVLLNGHVRQLPYNTYWASTTTAADTYQNGGYWPTALGWFAYAIDFVDSAKADKCILDMVRYMQSNAVYEWINSSTGGVPNYTSSATLPLEGIRAMLTRRAGGSVPNVPRC